MSQQARGPLGGLVVMAGLAVLMLGTRPAAGQCEFSSEREPNDSFDAAMAIGIRESLIEGDIVRHHVEDFKQQSGT